MKQFFLVIKSLFTNITIKSVIFKIIVILLFMSLTTVIVSMVGISKIHDMNQVANDIFYSNSSVLFPLSDTLQLIYNVEHIASRAIVGESAAISELSSQTSNVTGQLGNFDFILSEEDLSLITEKSKKYQESLRNLYNELRNEGPSVAPIYHEFQLNSSTLYTSLFNLGKKYRIKGLDTYNRGKRIYSSVILLQTWITILGVLVAIFIGILVALSIIKPLGQLRNSSDLLAKGDLRVKAKILSHDEVGAVAGAFNRAVEQLRLMVVEAANDAKNITSSSNELSNAASETSRSLGELNQLVEELSVSANTQTNAVESAIKMVQKASEGAKSVTQATIEINKTCNEASIAAKRGGEAAGEMTKAINTLVETVSTITKMVEDLAEDSKEIQNLVDVIRDISEKTNLLSLNASIEAARAGEQGRGFAVVATSIRQLAAQSRESVEHIDEVINKIFEKTNRAVTTMEEGNMEVNKGQQTIIETAGLFKELVRQVDQIVTSISHITKTANQLDESNLAVINEMSKVSQISQDNLAAVEEVSATFEEQFASTMIVAEAAKKLQEMAGQLSTAAEKFKV